MVQRIGRKAGVDVVDAIDVQTTFTDPSGTDHTGTIEDDTHAAEHESGGADTVGIGNLTGSVALGQLGNILDGNNDVESDHLDNALKRLSSSDRSDVTSSVSFDTWRQPDTNNPTLVTITLQVVGTSGTSATINTDIDEDADDTAEHTHETRTRSSGLATNADVVQVSTITLLLAASEQYQIRNTSDPDGQNTIETVTETTL